MTTYPLPQQQPQQSYDTEGVIMMGPIGDLVHYISSPFPTRYHLTRSEMSAYVRIVPTEMNMGIVKTNGQWLSSHNGLSLQLSFELPEQYPGFNLQFNFSYIPQTNTFVLVRSVGQIWTQGTRDLTLPAPVYDMKVSVDGQSFTITCAEFPYFHLHHIAPVSISQMHEYLRTLSPIRSFLCDVCRLKKTTHGLLFLNHPVIQPWCLSCITRLVNADELQELQGKSNIYQWFDGIQIWYVLGWDFYHTKMKDHLINKVWQGMIYQHPWLQAQKKKTKKRITQQGYLSE